MSNRTAQQVGCYFALSWGGASTCELQEDQHLSIENTELFEMKFTANIVCCEIKTVRKKFQSKATYHPSQGLVRILVYMILYSYQSWNALHGGSVPEEMSTMAEMPKFGIGKGISQVFKTLKPYRCWAVIESDPHKPIGSVPVITGVSTRIRAWTNGRLGRILALRILGVLVGLSSRNTNVWDQAHLLCAC